MGTRKHSGCPDQAQSLYPNVSSRQWTDAGKPHKHCYGKLFEGANRALADHPQLFKRIVKQFDGMRKRNAFMEGYKKTAPFAENLNEFDEAREVVQDLIQEYEAAEDADYLNPDTGEKATSAETDKRVG